mmetsp:Transcript_10438/g.31015  ORF Transcript_10438/g.31015 Transcript_10438/m.31015 type:complete len:240 (-) Transcript_10438:1896-2615(-)
MHISCLPWRGRKRRVEVPDTRPRRPRSMRPAALTAHRSPLWQATASTATSSLPSQVPARMAPGKPPSSRRRPHPVPTQGLSSLLRVRGVQPKLPRTAVPSHLTSPRVIPVPPKRLPERTCHRARPTPNLRRPILRARMVPPASRGEPRVKARDKVAPLALGVRNRPRWMTAMSQRSRGPPGAAAKRRYPRGLMSQRRSSATLPMTAAVALAPRSASARGPSAQPELLQTARVQCLRARE